MKLKLVRKWKQGDYWNMRLVDADGKRYLYQAGCWNTPPGSWTITEETPEVWIPEEEINDWMAKY